MQRSRLRRVAKEYIRPGVHIADLHTSLVLVQEQRSLWADYATTQRHPAVPSGLADLRSGYHQLGSDLARLGAALERTAQGGALEQMEYSGLVQRLEALAGDRETLESLPERTLLLESMREHGLGELLDDLADREVGPAETRSELELAWWQSALEAMISGDDYLAMSDGESLRQLEAEYRLADQAHISSGSARLRWELARTWNSAVAGRSRPAELLRNLLKDGRVTLEALSAQAPDLLSNLVPVWAVSPLVLPAVVPRGSPLRRRRHPRRRIDLAAGSASGLGPGASGSGLRRWADCFAACLLCLCGAGRARGRAATTVAERLRRPFPGAAPPPADGLLPRRGRGAGPAAGPQLLRRRARTDARWA